jgi:hypothetical protein
MRTILVTILLLIMVIAIYEVTIGGETGAQSSVETRANHIHTHIQEIEP